MHELCFCKITERMIFMTKTKILSLLTASMLSASCLGMTAFADTAYETGDVDMDGVITGHDAGMISKSLL